MSKVIQMIQVDDGLMVLRDDGSMWYQATYATSWDEVEPPTESSVNCEPEKSRDISRTVSELIRKPYRS